MNDARQFGELTRDEAAAVIGWRYGGWDAFYDTAADPELAAEFTEPDLETARVSRPAQELGGQMVEFIKMELAADGLD